MSELEKQVALYTEKKSEAGSIDYFAPGDELDSLTKALLIACFAARPYISGKSGDHIGGGGSAMQNDSLLDIMPKINRLGLDDDGGYDY